MRPLRHREVKWLAQDHTAGQRQSWAFNHRAFLPFKVQKSSQGEKGIPPGIGHPVPIPESASFIGPCVPSRVGMCTHKHLCVYFSSLHDFFFTHVCVLKCYPAPSLLSLNNTPLRSFLMGTWILTFYTFANYSTERINQAVFSFIVVKYTWHKTYHFKHFKMYNSFF